MVTVLYFLDGSSSCMQIRQNYYLALLNLNVNTGSCQYIIVVCVGNQSITLLDWLAILRQHDIVRWTAFE